MITSAVFLGSKKFGLNLFIALYEADPTITWTVLCPPDLSDTRTYFSEFQEYAKAKNPSSCIPDLKVIKVLLVLKDLKVILTHKVL